MFGYRIIHKDDIEWYESELEDKSERINELFDQAIRLNTKNHELLEELDKIRIDDDRKLESLVDQMLDNPEYAKLAISMMDDNIKSNLIKMLATDGEGSE